VPFLRVCRSKDSTYCITSFSNWTAPCGRVTSMAAWLSQAPLGPNVRVAGDSCNEPALVIEARPEVGYSYEDEFLEVFPLKFEIFFFRVR